jgi:methyl-accepting chemotaxis protein
MKKANVYIIQASIILVSVVFLILRPVPVLWADIAVFLIFSIAMTLLLAGNMGGWRKEQAEKLKNLEFELKQFNKEVNVSSSQISSVSEQLYVTLDENNAFAQQLFAETGEMAQMNTEVNNEITGVINGIKEVIELLQTLKLVSEGMESHSRTSGEGIKAGFSEIMGIVEAVREIQTASDTIRSYIDRLSESSDEIIHILESVTSISKQTQLLSLNAAIESARAGEAGKGFAVVADEIQKLAVETGRAVKEIGSLTNSIREEIRSVYEVAVENAAKVEKGVSVSKIIESSINYIDDAFSKMNASVEEICSISIKEEQLTRAMEDRIEGIEENIHTVSGRVENVYNSVHKQKHSIQELADMSVRLNQALKGISMLAGGDDASEDVVLDTEKVKGSVGLIKKSAEELAEKLGDADPEVHRTLLMKYITENELIEAVWSNDKKGRFICSIPEAGIANASIREWFKRSLLGEEYVSSVYISAITRNPCVTYSIPIKDRNGEISGVFGVDVKI